MIADLKAENEQMKANIAAMIAKNRFIIRSPLNIHGLRIPFGGPPALVVDRKEEYIMKIHCLLFTAAVLFGSGVFHVNAASPLHL